MPIRVAVQLMPRAKEDAFANALKAAGLKSNLRINDVRCSKDLSSVMDQCKRHWADVLGAMGGRQLVIYEGPAIKNSRRNSAAKSRSG